MKKFKGDKPLKIIERTIKQKGGRWNQDDFDKGGDWINFSFPHKEDGLTWHYPVVYNTFNGRFMVKIDKKIYTERDSNMDDTPWYAALLNTIYITEESEAA